MHEADPNDSCVASEEADEPLVTSMRILQDTITTTGSSTGTSARQSNGVHLGTTGILVISGGCLALLLLVIAFVYVRPSKCKSPAEADAEEEAVAYVPPSGETTTSHYTQSFQSPVHHQDPALAQTEAKSRALSFASSGSESHLPEEPRPRAPTDNGSFHASLSECPRLSTTSTVPELARESQDSTDDDDDLEISI